MPNDSMSRIITDASSNVEAVALDGFPRPLDLVTGPEFYFKDSGIREDLPSEQLRIEIRAISLR